MGYFSPTHFRAGLPQQACSIKSQGIPRQPLQLKVALSESLYWGHLAKLRLDEYCRPIMGIHITLKTLPIAYR